MKILILFFSCILSVVANDLIPGNIPVTFTTTSLSNSPLSVINVTNISNVGFVNANGFNFVSKINNVSSNSFTYIAGLTSDAQTQLNNKQTQIDTKQPIFITGLGITNVSGTLSLNMVAGSGVSLVTGVNGQQNISASGTIGTLVNTANTSTGQLLQFLDNTKTNTGPVNIGAGLTNISGVLSSTRFRMNSFSSIAISNSTAETDLVNFTVPANTLVGNAIVITGSGILINNNIADTITFRIKFNGNIYYQDVSVSLVTSAISRAFTFNFLLGGGNGVTAPTVLCGGNISIGGITGTTTGTGDIGTSATLSAPIVTPIAVTENISADMLFQFTAQFGSASANYRLLNLQWKGLD